MKILFAVICTTLLIGCGDWMFWTHTEVETASKSCLSRGGNPQMTMNRDKRVLNMYCQFTNGDRYQINTKGEF